MKVVSVLAAITTANAVQFDINDCRICLAKGNRYWKLTPSTSEVGEKHYVCTQSYPEEFYNEKWLAYYRRDCDDYSNVNMWWVGAKRYDLEDCKKCHGQGKIYWHYKPLDVNEERYRKTYTFCDVRMPEKYDSTRWTAVRVSTCGDFSGGDLKRWRNYFDVALCQVCHERNQRFCKAYSITMDGSESYSYTCDDDCNWESKFGYLATVQDCRAEANASRVSFDKSRCEECIRRNESYYRLDGVASKDQRTTFECLSWEPDVVAKYLPASVMTRTRLERCSYELNFEIKNFDLGLCRYCKEQGRRFCQQFDNLEKVVKYSCPKNSEECAYPVEDCFLQEMLDLADKTPYETCSECLSDYKNYFMMQSKSGSEVKETRFLCYPFEITDDKLPEGWTIEALEDCTPSHDLKALRQAAEKVYRSLFSVELKIARNLQEPS